MQKYEHAAWNSSTGLPIANPTITVNYAGGALATIYSDEGVTTKANPLTGDASGRFSFYAPPGDYDVIISGAGVTSYTLSDVTIVDLKGEFLARVTKSAAQSIPNVTETSLTWDTEAYDVGAIHSMVTNTNRLTVPAWIVGTIILDLDAAVRWVTNATGERLLQIKNQAGTVIASVRAIANSQGGAPTDQHIGTQVSAVAGNWFEVVVYQQSGAALNVDPGMSHFAMRFAGKV